MRTLHHHHFMASRCRAWLANGAAVVGLALMVLWCTSVQSLHAACHLTLTHGAAVAAVGICHGDDANVCHGDDVNSGDACDIGDCGDCHDNVPHSEHCLSLGHVLPWPSASTARVIPSGSSSTTCLWPSLANPTASWRPLAAPDYGRQCYRLCPPPWLAASRQLLI
jgi:hypothetical protein